MNTVFVDLARSTDKTPSALAHAGAGTVTVSPWDFPMECDYEYDEGESPIFWPTERAHPGSPSCVTLVAARVGGTNVYEMLSGKQIDRLEAAILELVEG